MWPRLASNLLQSWGCLHLSSVGIKDMQHHAQLHVVMTMENHGSRSHKLSEWLKWLFQFN